MRDRIRLLELEVEEFRNILNNLEGELREKMREEIDNLVFEIELLKKKAAASGEAAAE
jgi:hypothetical protein